MDTEITESHGGHEEGSLSRFAAKPSESFFLRDLRGFSVSSVSTFLVFFLVSVSPSPATAQTTAPGPDWLPRPGVQLQALDKVSAKTTLLDGRVGTPMQFGSLTITVSACVVRPPDRPQDAAAFVQITDSHQSEPGFRGWMFEDEPSLAIFQHPLYDVRLNGCRT